MNNNPIGIFDSGIGGLSILKVLHDYFPQESFFYYADTARAPYGDKSKEALIVINDEITDFLIQENSKCIVFACNTSCALIYKDLSQTLSVPSIELIYPAAKKALSLSPNKRIAILGTIQTIQSKAYYNALKSLDKSSQIIEVACPKLVPYVENNQINSPEAKRWAKQYLDNALEQEPETLIHGCSHYPFFESFWKEHSPRCLKFINPAHALKENLQTILNNNNNTQNKGKITFYVSGESSTLKLHVKRLFDSSITTIKKIPIKAR